MSSPEGSQTEPAYAPVRRYRKRLRVSKIGVYVSLEEHKTISESARRLHVPVAVYVRIAALAWRRGAK